MKPSSKFLWLFPALVATGCFYSPPGTTDGGQPELHQSIFRGMLLTHQNVNGFAVAEGDMILGEAGRLETADSDSLAKRNELIAISGDGYRWPSGVVPYLIPPSFPSATVAQGAIDHWNTKLAGVIHFVPRTTEADYVVFQTSNQCASYIGKIGGPQAVWVGGACTTGNLIHELGHALGALHEQNRIDRDDHVRIHWENVAPGSESEFEKTGDAQGTDLGAYDFGSIMHYGATADSVNGQVTIETIPAGIAIGQRDGLSAGDVSNMTSLYGGGQAPPTSPPAQSGPVISNQPQNISIQAGSNATFTVAATGSGTLTYQWYKDGLTLAGQQTPTLALTNVQVTQGGNYWVRVANTIGTTESTHALLTVTSTPAPPASSSSALSSGIPVTVSGTQFQQLRFTFTIPQGATQLSIQMSGGTGDADLYVSFNTPPTLAQWGCRPYIEGNNESCPDANPEPGTYDILVFGYTAFSGAQLVASYVGGSTNPPPTANPPIILTQPVGASVQAGGNALFSVTASGDGKLGYQWYKDGVPLSGQTGTQLALSNVQSSQSGSYWVVVSNSAGNAESQHVVLSVNTTVPTQPPAGNGAIPLANGAPVQNLSGGPGTNLLYSIQVPAGATLLSVRLQGGVGDADLFVRYGSPPDTIAIGDCVSNGNTTNEFCGTQYPVAGTYYILVSGYFAFTGVELIASYSAAQVTVPAQQAITLTATFVPPSYYDPFDGHADLSWTAVGNAEYYAVYRNGLWIGNVYGLQFTDQFIPANYHAAYQVFAIFAQTQIAASQLVLVGP